MTNSPAPDLSIVILNWNVSDLLEACLRALPAALGDWSARSEIIVVDNASNDGSVAMVRGKFQSVKVIELKRNLGFSAGNNVGIRASQGKCIFLLNPDTVPHPNAIAKLTDYMEAHTEVGLVGPRLLNPDGTLQPSRRRFPTLTTALIESTAMQKWLPNVSLLRRFYMLDKPDDETQVVGWVSGAALMCRREALTQVGLLDPGYFMFSEEVDLCRRMSNAGWRITYLPEAEITHYGGQSTSQDVPARHIRFNTSKARYFRLHEGRIAGNVVRLYLLGIYGVQMASEGVKWLLGHKRSLRRERVRMYAQVIRSGLHERRPSASSKERVLLITGEYPPAQGGVGDYTCKLNVALQERGVATRVLTRTLLLESGESRQELALENPQAQEGSLTVGAVSSKNIPFTTPRVTVAASLRAINSMHAAIAHIQYQTGAYEMRPTINLLPLLLRRRWRGATVVTFHDLLVPYLFPKTGPVREWANRLLARSADAAIATNPEDAERLRAWGVKSVRLIPIGSNIPNSPPADYNREQWRASWELPEDTTLLAYFGFLNSSKGLGDLLGALSLLKDKGSYKLMIVGGTLGSTDPTNRATAEALDIQARQLGVDESIIWTGYLDSQDVSAALLSADIAVLPYADGASFRRGSLLAVLEHGLPLITTQTEVRSPKSKVQSAEWPRLVDGENAVLVSPGNTVALAESIQRLAADIQLRTKLAAGARELARFFSWDHIAEMHLELYQDLLEEKQNR
jgi:GT2 family glycosyltransferase/glycosyltransferase involved in cell wall biosynthesis